MLAGFTLWGMLINVFSRVTWKETWEELWSCPCFSFFFCLICSFYRWREIYFFVNHSSISEKEILLKCWCWEVGNAIGYVSSLNSPAKKWGLVLGASVVSFETHGELFAKGNKGNVFIFPVDKVQHLVPIWIGIVVSCWCCVCIHKQNPACFNIF